jgi:hypothetical protein
VTVAGAAPGAPRLPAGLPASAALLLRYDANHDGVITRAEMEAGLKAEFAAPTRTVTGVSTLLKCGPRTRPARRATARKRLPYSIGISTAAWMRKSYFDLADKTTDGKVSMIQLRGLSAPPGPRTGAAVRAGVDSAGSKTQTPTNPSTGLPNYGRRASHP